MGEKRWNVQRTYIVNGVRVTTIEQVEEICEVHDLVEAGPDWNYLVDVKITLNRMSGTPEGELLQ